MARFIEIARQIVRDEEGASAIEYGLIAGGIAIGIILAVTQIGTSLTTIFNTIQTKLATVGS